MDELIARVDYFHIVRVNGTPASGKTILMNLVANRLFELHGSATPIFCITGWDRNISQIGWAAHLEQLTGVNGRDWIDHEAYLLLDEAQMSHWDLQLWAELFKSIEPGTKPYIVLFMSYGSPNRGFAGFDPEHVPTPMNFAPEQQISLQPQESVETRCLGRLRWRPVGLLLDKDEAMEVVHRYALILCPSMAVTPDLKQGFFACSSGHVGLLIGLIRLLLEVPVSLTLELTVQVQY